MALKKNRIKTKETGKQADSAAGKNADTLAILFDIGVAELCEIAALRALLGSSMGTISAIAFPLDPLLGSVPRL